MENTYRKSAMETLQDFEDMMEKLKPYLPKPIKAEPIKQRQWKIAGKGLIPLPEHL